MRAAASIRMALLLFLVPSVSSATTVNLTVKEPTGVARTADPVTIGVPVAMSDTLLAWKLMDGATEIPLRTKVLFGVRNPWLLLDFQTSLAANQTKTLQLVSQTPTANPSPALAFTEDATSITVTTGTIKVLIKKNPFNLFDTVWFDPDGVYPTGKRVVIPPGSNPDNLPLKTNDNTVYVGKGTPTAITWEYKNSLRAVLRVDGVYGNSATPILRYTTRMTFHAGQSFVTIDHLIRNSEPLEERYVKVRSATLRVGPGTTPALVRAARSGARSWANHVKGTGLALETIPPTVVVTTGYDANGRRINMDPDLDVDANGGLVIGDMSYHGASFRVDFATGLTSPEQIRRAGCYAERLIPVAPSTWYSDLGALGAQNFETYEDETSSHARWGWTDTTATVPFLKPHALGPVPASWYPSWSYLHPNQSPESDDTWMNLVQFVRTGNRAYFDRAEGWARYVSWERVMRTDGWTYAWDGYWDGQPPTVHRPRTPLGGSYDVATDSAYIKFNMCNTVDERRGAGHMWASGVVDYYYMTGDRSALECAADIGDIVKRVTDWRAAGTPTGSPNGYPRGEARMYFNVIRLYEATGDAVWRTSADHLKAMLLQATSWDSRGFYYSNIATELPPSYSSRFPNGKVISPFSHGTLVPALYRDYLLTGDLALKQRLLDLGAFAYSNAATDANGYTGDVLVLDSPTYGTAQHLSYGQWDNSDPTHVSYASSTNSFLDALVVASRLAYDGRYLARAKDMWAHCSKAYWAGSPFATATQRGRFVNALEGDGYTDDNYLYPFAGDLTSTQFFFYDASRKDYVPPTAIVDLAVGFYSAWSTATWTSPADDGPLGFATEYDLRYSTSPITESNFATLGQIPTPGPLAPGAEQCADVTLDPCQSYYFAIRSRDADGNWSALSNIVQAGGVCPPHGSGPICGPFSRTADPRTASSVLEVPREVEFAVQGSNPAKQSVVIAFGIPASRSGEVLSIAVYDVTGRRVALLASDRATAGRRTVLWNLQGSDGVRVRNGVYYAQLRLGSERWTQKMLFVR